MAVGDNANADATIASTRPAAHSRPRANRFSSIRGIPAVIILRPPFLAIGVGIKS
jgi:hypothetical protein